MKIFLWDNVLKDWSYGVAIAVAPDVVTAKILLINQYREYLLGHGSLMDDEEDELYPSMIRFKQDLEQNPKELSCDEIFCFFRQGGS